MTIVKCQLVFNIARTAMNENEAVCNATASRSQYCTFRYSATWFL